jgi:hypothetical protein
MPKVLLLDIETAPILAYVWARWKQNVAMNQVAEDWQILTWAAKWLDDKHVYTGTAFDGENVHDDAKMLWNLHGLLDEADIVIAHNGKRFDIPRINARLMKAGMAPPSPYKQIDTFIEAKKTFAFTSNRLDDLGDFLEVGRKKDTGGFSLWTRCLQGDASAWDKMLKYNIQDVKLLEKVYLALRAWMPNHPNLGVYTDDLEPQCPKCGGNHLQHRGYAYTQVGKYHRYQCLDCGGWSRGRFTINEIEKRQALINNAG